MSVTNSTRARNDMLDAIAASKVNRLSIFTGAPVGANVAQSGTELARFTLNATPFPAASSASVTANSIADVTALATGTAGSFVFWNSAGTAITSTATTGANDTRIGGTVATSGGDLTIDNTSVVSGQTVHIASGPTLTAPA